ncbi:MAG TPA: PAS domain S-box protein, partial [Candidatus Binataceae bacterium]|nr:PAS domain S-box protein [Candidatus Binataceae bacterium]
MVQFGFVNSLGLYLLEQLLFVVLIGGLVFLIARHYSAAARTLIEESAATAQALFESAAQGIVIVDQHGAIVSANPQLVQTFGYDRAELVGQKIEMLLPERLRDVHVAHRREYLNSPRPRPMGLGLDLVGRRKDG